MEKEINIDWEPQERQLVCLKACGLSEPFEENLELRPSGSTGEPFKQSVADIIGYGGAAGGGKSDTLLAIAIVACITYPGINVAYFRREFPNLEGLGGVIDRSKELISHFAKYNDQKHRWKFPNGSNIQFCHAQNLGDEKKYKSQQFDILLIDEVTEFNPEQIDFLVTRNRATVKYDTFRPFTAVGTNPGGIGHGWFKTRFVELGEPEIVHTFTTETGIDLTHIFIPAHLADNQILEQRDPGYRIKLSSTEMNRRLYLYGEWDAFIGQAFSELNRDVHIINSFPIPDDWMIFGAYDHGFNHPYSFGLFAVDGDGNVYLIKRIKGRLKRPDEIARLIVECSGDLFPRIKAIYAGTDCWNPRKERTEPSIAELFLKNDPQIRLTPASTARVAGAAQIRQFIAWKDTQKDKDGKIIDGKPRFFIFREAAGVYETLSNMLFDPNDSEDVLKVDAVEGVGGDDDYDMVRYGLMSRPRPLKPKDRKPKVNSFEAYFRKKREAKLLHNEYVGY